MAPVRHTSVARAFQNARVVSGEMTHPRARRGVMAQPPSEGGSRRRWVLHGSSAKGVVAGTQTSLGWLEPPFSRLVQRTPPPALSWVTCARFERRVVL